MGAQTVKHGTVARAEVASAAVQDEPCCLRRRDGKPDAERVLETAPLECQVVQLGAAELAASQEVGKLHGAGAPLPKESGDRTLRTQDGHDRLPVDAAVDALVTRTLEVVTGSITKGLEKIAVADPLRGY